MGNEYVVQRNGGYYIQGARVSLDSVVLAFLRGDSPESIVDSFPSLTLEQVFGAITFYLANQRAVDAYLQGESARFLRLRKKARGKHPLLNAKLDRARHSATISRR
jgi:uncharacterized protein (DUF433 family)